MVSAKVSSPVGMGEKVLVSVPRQAMKVFMESFFRVAR
jgi:hypothetical protein